MNLPDSTILIHSQALLRMISLSGSALPNEACGILGGQFIDTESTRLSIETVYPIANRATSRSFTFSFAPEEWVSAYYAMQKNRQSLVGFFHSHPTTPPIPSQADLAGMQWSSIPTYWIISLADRDASNIAHVKVYRKAGQTWLPSMFTQISI
nr:M67 family metallopeptidase [Paenibacillus phyllosphaerae]